jgi:hypothetical protein
MGYDLLTILELCGIVGFAFWFVGSIALMVGVHHARREFRSKGYLRSPRGKGWINFLLWKQYDYFENPSIRFYFGVAHFCLIGMFIVFTAVVVLLGSELLLQNVGGFPSALPDISLPK